MKSTDDRCHSIRPHNPRRSNTGGSALAEGLEQRTLLSAGLVSDINPGTLGSNPQGIFAAGNEVYFSTPVPNVQNAAQFWKTDGTEAGTLQDPALTAKLAVGPISDWVQFHGYTYFTDSHILWRTDGTAAGTTELSGGDGLWVAGDRLYNLSTYLVVTDGSTTTAVFKQPTNYVAFAPTSDGKLYFVTKNFTTGEQQLWVSDGSAAGTQLLRGGFDGPNVVLAAARPGLVYLLDPGTGPNHGLWKTDGTPGGTTLISPVSGENSQFNQMALVGDEVFFTGQSDAHDTQLWKSDGTAAGTMMVAPVGSDSSRSAPSFFNFNSVNGLLTFTVSDGDPTVDGLWRSDGTSAGTFQLLQAQLNHPVTVFNNAVYFSADDMVHGTQLWRSDGTRAGTGILDLIDPYGPANPQNITAAGGALYFSADDGIHGQELWTSDGTTAGTHLVKDINVQPASSHPSDPVAFNGKLYFSAIDQHGAQIWSSDGTAAGTTRVTSLSEYETNGTDPRFPHIENLTTADGTLFFTTAALNLWKTDGTEAGTSQLLNVAQLHLSSLSGLQAVGDHLFFFANHYAELGVPPDMGELWTSDGTAAGTKVVASWPLPANEVLPLASAPLRGKLVFQVMNGNSIQLWSSDGTAAGTASIADFSRPGGTEDMFQNPSLLTQSGVVGDTLYFIDSEKVDYPNSAPVVYHDLWKTDGTAAGTMQVSASFPYNPPRFFELSGQGFFFAKSGTGVGLYRLDSSATGAALVTNVPALSPNAPAVVLDGRLYFSAGYRLYVSDGTAAGTKPVIDLGRTAFPYLGPVWAVTSAGKVYFFSYNTSGRAAELWQSDGTAAGTVPVIALSPGPQTALFAGPPEMPPTPAGNRLFFSADDGVHGDELWAADVSIAGSVFDDANHNGARDPGETGLAGVTVFLDSNNNGKLDSGESTAVTDANGNYLFNGLAPGTYLVRQVSPPAYNPTTPPAPGAAALIGAATAGPVFGDVLLSSVPLGFSELLNLARHYNQAATFSNGDLNGDGIVNFDDLLLLVQNYSGGSNASPRRR